jgi:hypothetical protein
VQRLFLVLVWCRLSGLCMRTYILLPYLISNRSWEIVLLISTNQNNQESGVYTASIVAASLYSQMQLEIQNTVETGA